MSGAEVALGVAAPAGMGPSRFVTLADSGLEIEANEIARLFEPFVLRGPREYEAWARAVARRKRKLLKATVRRLALGWLPSMQRREATVLDEYDRAWATIDYAAYGLEAPQSGHTPWECAERACWRATSARPGSGSCC